MVHMSADLSDPQANDCKTTYLLVLANSWTGFVVAYCSEKAYIFRLENDLFRSLLSMTSWVGKVIWMFVFCTIVPMSLLEFDKP